MRTMLLHNASLRATVLALAASVACGCGSTPGGSQGGEEIRSDKQRVLSPQVDPADLSAQVSGDTAFAFDVYQKIRTEPKNLFFSPHSISLALAMLQGGARGATETQMNHALQYVLPQDRLHPAFDKLDLELASRGQGKKAADGKAFRLNIVNALWGQTGYGFVPTYLDLLALNYGAGLRTLDFEAQPEDSRIIINEWVERKTESRIKDLLPEGSIDSLTRLVLTNAIYFNAAWAQPFEEKNTKPEPFHRADGTTVSAPMMTGGQKGFYAQGTDYQAVTLPYDGDELSMLVIVPDPGKFDSVEASLSGPAVESLVQSLSPAEIALTLPKLELTAPLDVVPVLKALGMVDAFTDAADLSGINGRRDLQVTGVLHKAFVKLNEAGTEAAAATAVVVGTSSAGPQKQVTLKVDRPFIILIRDNATGAVLFLGRVLDPTVTS